MRLICVAVKPQHEGFAAERSGNELSEGVWGAPSHSDGQAQVENLCYGGSLEPVQTLVDPPCICPAERDCRYGRCQ